MIHGPHFTTLHGILCYHILSSNKSRYGHVEVVKELLKSAADVNSKNGNGSTPLHYAAGCGQIEIVKLLLAHGADKNIKDNEKNTPLQLTKQLQPNGWNEIVSLLN